LPTGAIKDAHGFGLPLAKHCGIDGVFGEIA
jgi:hypothetical protein